MGIARTLVDGIRGFGQVRQRDPQSLSPWYPRVFSGVPLSVDDALALSTVWACVNAIAVAVSTRRWNVFQPDGPGRRKLLPDDRVAYLLNTRPNAEMTGISFREALIWNMLIHGNAYAEIVPDGSNRVAELWPIQADRVTPRRNRDTSRLEYVVHQDTGLQTVLTPDRVFHLKGPGLSGLMGDHVVSRAAGSLALAVAAERFASTYFGNNTVIDTVIEYPQALNSEARKRAIEELEERHKGPAKAHRPLILSNGAKMSATTHDAERSQVLQARKFTVEEICRWFNVPPHKVHHLERMTFNNVEELGIDFVRSACEPVARRLEQEADYKLFPQTRGPWRQTEINLAPLTWGNAKARAEAHAILRQNGLASANELREEDGMNAIPGPEGDALLVQTNMTTVEKLLSAPAPGAPAPAPAPAEAGDQEDDAAEEPAGDMMDARLVRDALVSMVSASLERYRGRAAGKGDAERERQRTWLVAELSDAIRIAAQAGFELTADRILAAADAVDAGAAPRELVPAQLLEVAA